MKSTKTEKTMPFSLEDFEKGLMLAGYISPRSISEIKEREALDTYEQSLTKEKKADNPYFKRAVLAAEIANQLHMEPTFGHVKFQKLVYLCEHAAKMNLHHRYSKQAAGPFDNKFMHSIDSEFKKQKWFNVELVKDGKYTKYKYVPLPTVSKYKPYFESNFQENMDNINTIISLFRNHRTDFVELVATIYACMVELMAKNQAPQYESVLPMFYAWSKEKGRFKESDVKGAFEWMQTNQISPQQ